MSSGFIAEKVRESKQHNFALKEAEAAVIYSLATKGDDVKQHIIRLSEEDFYCTEYGRIFNAIKAAAVDGAVDIVTIDSALSKLYPDEAEKLTGVLIDTINVNYNVWNIEDYIKIVKELSERRKAIANMRESIAKLNDPENDVQSVIEELREQSAAIESGKPETMSMADVMLNTYEYISQKQANTQKTIASGIRGVDDLIGGFFGGELTIVGARPAVGKSAFGATIAYNAANKGFHVAICSREMTDVQFGQRMISRDAHIDGMKLRRGNLDVDDWQVIGRSMPGLSKLPIAFMFKTRDIESLYRICVSKRQKKELDLLIVDYLQLMQTTQRFQAEHLRVGYISRELKNMAVELGIPVIALAQVNRDVDGQMPTLRSLKDSGSIEQDADGVIFLHKPQSETDPFVDPRDRPYFGNYAEKGLDYMCVGVAKQRQGVTGKTCLLFDSSHMRYMGIER